MHDVLFNDLDITYPVIEGGVSVTRIVSDLHEAILELPERVANVMPILADAIFPVACEFDRACVKIRIQSVVETYHRTLRRAGITLSKPTGLDSVTNTLILDDINHHRSFLVSKADYPNGPELRVMEVRRDMYLIYELDVQIKPVSFLILDRTDVCFYSFSLNQIDTIDMDIKTSIENQLRYRYVYQDTIPRVEVILPKLYDLINSNVDLESCGLWDVELYPIPEPDYEKLTEVKSQAFSETRIPRWVWQYDIRLSSYKKSGRIELPYSDKSLVSLYRTKDTDGFKFMGDESYLCPYWLTKTYEFLSSRFNVNQK